MDKKIEKIYNNIAYEYKQDNNVIGILLFGSVAKNKSDKYSDIDIYILLKNKGKYSRLNFIKEGYRIDILFNTIEEINSYINREKNSIKRNVSHMLAYGKIIYQMNNNLTKILVSAKTNLKLKTKYKIGEILMHKYSIDDFWGEVKRDIENKNYIAFGLDSGFLINNIIELVLKLNGSFFGQPNEMVETLNKIDPEFSKKIENFYKTENIQKKKNILSELVKYVYKKSDGPLPKKWMLDSK